MTDCDEPDWIGDQEPCGTCPHRAGSTDRLAAVHRLPVRLLPMAMTDPAPEVRREVARLIGEEWLAAMAWDSDSEVRLIVVGRLRPEQLTVLAGDSDVRVRAAVAGRVVASALVRLAEDSALEVRRVARLRLGPGFFSSRADPMPGAAARARRRLM